MKTIRPIVASVLALCALQASAAEAAKKHIVTFRRLDGTILNQVQVAHGGKAVAPAAPAVPDFRFKGWDGAERLSRVTTSATRTCSRRSTR